MPTDRAAPWQREAERRHQRLAEEGEAQREFDELQ
jgi:hypothetical protein